MRQEWPTAHPTLAAVRERYFSHLGSDRALIRRINSGTIPLKFHRTGGTRQGTAFVYLRDLAEYLDSIQKQAA
nr:pyocin activator PrtN family protein [Pseudomonas chlororaphis]